MMRLTRRYRFCASHRLHSSALTEADNQELYGKCNNPYGHGHDYLMEITVAGSLNRQTGQLLPVPLLDEAVQTCVLRDFDHKNLNTEVVEFQQLVPTSENLALVIEKRLNESWAARFGEHGPRLENVKLHETKRNRFELR